MIAIMIPEGTSLGTRSVLLSTSAIIRNTPPNKAEVTNKCLWAGPNSMRATWGAINPKKPIV